MFSRCDCVECA